MDCTVYTHYYNCINTRKIEKDMALFESHNGIDFAGNMLRLADKMSTIGGYRIIVVYTSDSKDRIEKLIEKYQILNVSLVERESYEYFTMLASLKYYFSDVAFYPLYKKRKGQVCITTWHGTPLKTLGFDYMEDEYVVANQKRGFAIADYFISPNEYTWKCINKSYQLENIFNGTVLFEGYPRNSVFFENAERYDIIKSELGLENKKIIVYMPTWRGKVIDVKSQEQTASIQEYLEEWDSLISNEYVILAKLHRLNAMELDFDRFNNIIEFPEEYETYDVLKAADILVTDYSSVMFDFEVTRKKIILFCYDREDYINNRCCYFGLEKLPFPVVTTVNELVHEINLGKQYEDGQIVSYFNADDKIDSADVILDSILNNKVLDNSIKYYSNNIEALLFCGELNIGKETDMLFFELEKFSKVQLSVTYLNHLFKENWYKLLQLKHYKNIPFYMFQGSYIHYLYGEGEFVKELQNNIEKGINIDNKSLKTVESIYQRECDRFLYGRKLQCFIRYGGLDLDSLKFFISFKGKKIIYIHESMKIKCEKNKIFKFYVFKAMEIAEEVRFANESVYQYCFKELKKHTGKFEVLNLY